ncbi:M23 family metallopeptidase [Sphingosinicella sp. YJ22]|uniref:M23 family metallopeptidase n=1 Tax=Sphingosinicella sp. YJ22 TaxID=1104780 RepID=UPI00140E3339|nr:M23 family metallopeptidase [Sphingosinicella sp. YJ22]
MNRLKTLLTVVVTATITSLFWIVVYNGAASTSSASTATANAVADLPPGKAVTATLEGPARLVVAPSGLAIPVAGIGSRDLVDTYTQSRSGGARVHNAIDIMASRGTPVVAAAPGTVEKLFFSDGGGGISAYVRSDDRQWIYYYAHLDAYAPGLREGQRIARGAPIGTVGSTGNANPAGPHLHFAVNRMAPGERWHEGTPVNPYPLLAGNRASR